MNNIDFVKKVDKKIQDMHLLNHSFYQSWNEGSLSNDTIREYAAQYFQHVSAFPRYLSAIHSNCEDIKIRQILLENLVDEEKPELVILGKQAIDGDNNQTGTRVRACLHVLVLSAPLTPTRLL